jgi:hypothetical protein
LYKKHDKDKQKVADKQASQSIHHQRSNERHINETSLLLDEMDDGDDDDDDSRDDDDDSDDNNGNDYGDESERKEKADEIDDSEVTPKM